MIFFYDMTQNWFEILFGNFNVTTFCFYFENKINIKK